MRFVLSLALILLVSGVIGQTVPDTVVTDADIEIRFIGVPNPVWINGDDLNQTTFNVDSVSYSTEPLSTATTHTTKLNQPETWESEMFQLPGEPFRKAVIIIKLYEAPSRPFELRIRNRYAGETDAGEWSTLSDEDKVIGKPGKAIHRK